MKIGQRFVGLVRRLSAFVVSLLWREDTYDESPTAALVVNTPVPLVPCGALETQAARRVVRRRSTPLTDTGVNERDSARWHFKGTILDRLQEYFACVGRLRFYDPKAYDVFARIGFTVPAEVYAAGPVVSDANRPAYCGVLGPRSSDDKITPSFMYLVKVARPSRVQQFSGDVYQFTVIYDNRRRSLKWASDLVVPFRCHVGLSAEGAVILLREQVLSTSRFRRRSSKRAEWVELRSTHWRTPRWVDESAGEHGESAATWLSTMFSMTFNTAKSAAERVTIRVKSCGVAASFGIDLSRAKDFFADRAIEAASDGKRKRIFHAVSQHARIRHDGGVSNVKAHYRGARSFDWGGYQIRILLPRINWAAAFNAAGRYLDDVPLVDRSRFVPEGEAVRRIAAFEEA